MAQVSGGNDHITVLTVVRKDLPDRINEYFPQSNQLQLGTG